MAVRGGPAARYADALFSIARERNTADAWGAELQRLGAVLGDPDTLHLLGAPGLSVKQKQQALATIAGPFSREVGSMLTILIERKRIDQIPALAEAFADLTREAKGIELADVTTAVALSDADQRGVSQWLTRYLGHAVEVRYHVDPDLIGGLVARVGDQLIDASIRTRLDTLRKILRR